MHFLGETQSAILDSGSLLVSSQEDLGHGNILLFPFSWEIHLLYQIKCLVHSKLLPHGGGFGKLPLPTSQRYTESCGQAQGLVNHHSTLGQQDRDAEEGNNATESWDLLTALHVQVEKIEIGKFAPAALIKHQDLTFFFFLMTAPRYIGPTRLLCVIV